MSNSMLGHLTADDDAGEFKFSRQGNKKIIIFVEGEGDRNFYITRVRADLAEINDLLGRDNVIDVIKQYNKEKRSGYLGIVDKDFWGIEGHVDDIENLIYSEQYLNLEHMLIESEGLEKLLVEKVDKFMPSQINVSDVRRKIYSEASKVFKYRLLNDINNLGLNFKKLDLSAIYDLAIREIMEENLIDNLIKDRRISRDQLKLKAYELTVKYDISFKFQGHDATTILGLFFNNWLSSRTVRATHIEESLISSYDWMCFFETDLYLKLIEWQDKNKVHFFRRYCSKNAQ